MSLRGVLVRALVCLIATGCGFLPLSRTSRTGADLLESAAKPPPAVPALVGCGADGSQPDYALNRRKNRTDEARWIDVPWPTIARLPWPRAVGLRFRNQWTEGEQREVARYEGAPVRVEGYLQGFRLEGREPTNCYSDDPAQRDFHLWFAEEPGDARRQAVVIEITPRVRALHPGWTAERLATVQTSRDRIRVSGWLMLDQMHPERVGLNRATLWEIHPILQLEIRRDSAWIALDSLEMPTDALR